MRDDLIIFEEAARVVADGERCIARQRGIIAGLKGSRRHRVMLRAAQELLQTLELAQQFNIARRVEIAKGLEPRSTSPLKRDERN